MRPTPVNRAIPIWLLFLVALAGSAGAQSLDLTRARIPGGGGTSGGGQFTLFGTLGQAEAGPRLAGGAYEMDAGFLSATIPSPVPTVFFPQGTVTVLEDAGPQTNSAFAVFEPGLAGDPAQPPVYQLSNNNPALFGTPPAISTNRTLTFTPATNANGSALVTVVVRADGVDVATNTFAINVTAVNDAPVVTLAGNVTVLEDAGARTIAGFAMFTAGPADEATQAPTYTLAADNAALFSIAPAIAANGTLTFTPATNANGSATVTVITVDGGGTANGGADRTTNTFTLTVTAVNDAPSVAFAQSTVTVLEDAGAQTITSFATFTAGPADEATQTPTYTLTTDNAALFGVPPAIAPNGTLTFTTAANANGSATVTVVVQDSGGVANGGVDKSTNSFTITVTAVNDAPSVVFATNNVVAVKDTGAQTFTNFATFTAGPPDEASQTASYSLTTDNAPLFSAAPAIAPDGTLTFTSTAGAEGLANVIVVVQDSGGVANGGVDKTTNTFVITVVAFRTVADSYTVSEDRLLSVADNAGLLANDIGVGLNAALVAAPTNGVVTLNADGSFIYRPATNYYGPDAFTYRATNLVIASEPTLVTLTVTPVNDAPSVTFSSGTVMVLEDSGASSFANFAAFTAGPANESAQTLVAYTLSNSSNALFSVQPAINNAGTLTFTPAANANGSATVTVALQDNGGTDDGGVDRATNTFTITVTSVNDQPAATLAGDVTVLEDAGPQTRSGFVTSFSPGPADESAQTPTHLVSNNNAALFSTAPAIAPSGTLTFTSATNANGTALVTVVTVDGGGTANGGVDRTTNTFTITVTAVNDAPVANSDSYTMSQGDALTVAAPGVLANDTDVENDALTATKLTNPAHGTVTLNANGGFTYTPDTNFYGVDTFTYRASDFSSNSAPATVSLTVLARPVITPPPGKQRVFSSAALRFSATNAPDINAIRVDDPDSTRLTLTLTVTNGTLAITLTNGLAMPNGFTNTNTLVLAGIIADLNAALESLAYRSTTNYFGDDTLVLVAQDEGGRTNRGNGTVSLLVEVPALGGLPQVSLEGLNNRNTGRMITNVTAVATDTNLVEGITFDPTNNVVNVLPVGGQDGSTNRSTITVLARFNDGTTQLVTVPIIIYQPLLTSATNDSSTYNSTFATPVFNRQTSLYEQKVSVQNNTPFDFTALRITATNLPATVTLQNATITNGGRLYIDYNLAVRSGGNVTIKLEYFSSDLLPFTPGLKLELLNLARTNTAPTNAVMTAVAALPGQAGYSPDGRAKNYLKFPTKVGQLYYVQYQDAVGTNWKTSPVVITGTGILVNWLDDGPPSTDTPPPPARFYRVVTDR